MEYIQVEDMMFSFYVKFNFGDNFSRWRISLTKVIFCSSDYDAYGIPVDDFGGYMKAEKDMDGSYNNGSGYDDYQQHPY